MSLRTTLSTFTTLTLALALGLSACAGTPKEAAHDAAPMDPDAMMAAYAEANAINDHHRAMAEMAGTWDVAGKSWMMPDQPPLETTGTAEFTSILGGRYMRQVYTTDFMGMPYEGVGISGYDNARKVYVDHWFDNMGTAAYVSEGNWDDAGTTYTSEANHLDPVTGRTERMRNVITKLSDDQFVFSMYTVAPDGTAAMSMELTYTRRK